MKKKNRSITSFIQARSPELHSLIIIVKRFFKYIQTTWLYLAGMPIKGRKDLPILLNILNLREEGLELGVLRGSFSDLILSRSKLSRLHSIDPWRHFDSGEYADMCNVTQEEFDKAYIEVSTLLGRYGKRSNVVRMVSEDAAGLFEDNSLDFIYIDANHSYDKCKRDIKLWYPKLRNGGIFAGHDYVNGKFPNGDYGVKDAIDEFAKEHSQKLYITREEWPTWYLIKK